MNEIPDVVAQLRAGWRRLAAGLLAGLLLGVLVPALTPTTYTASSYLVVTPVGEGTATDAANFGKVFARVATDPVVLAAAVHLPDIRMTPAQVKEVVTVASSPDAPVLEVRGTGPTAFRSAEVANIVGQGIVLYVQQHADDTGYVLRQLVRAAPPAEPSAPRPVLSLVVGLALGLVVGTVAALVRRPRPAAVPGAPAQGTGPDGPGTDEEGMWALLRGRA